MTASAQSSVTPPAIQAVLDRLRAWDSARPAEDWWRTLPRDEWPALFELLAIAADVPRLADSSVFTGPPLTSWPELSRLAGDLLHLQQLVSHPVVPPGTEPTAAWPQAELEGARQALGRDHCVTVEDLLTTDDQHTLDRVIRDLAAEKMDTWGQLERDESPALFTLFENAVGGQVFRHLTGFDPARDPFTLTLSLQSLDGGGIGWHRDLYWPAEWVGRDVFAVLYALGDDGPEKGGAFLYWARESAALHAVYRRRHQATVVWNGRSSETRPLHAVSRYLGDDTSRHLIILQCLRRPSEP